jgi:ketosteroid isomerase-like protein
VSGSFFALLQGPSTLQFILTEVHVEVVGDAAWVVCNENLLGDQGGATVAAVNIFVRDGAGSRWLLASHHGSVVSAAIHVADGIGDADPGGS